MTRRIGRIVLAIAFGLSVVLLPARFAVAAVPTAATTMTGHHQQHQHAHGDMAPMAPMTHQHMMQPDMDHGDQPQKPAGDCGSFVGCALSCGSFTGVAFSGIAYAPIAGAVLRPLHADESIRAETASPPFRPPRA